MVYMIPMIRRPLAIGLRSTQRGCSFTMSPRAVLLINLLNKISSWHYKPLGNAEKWFKCHMVRRLLWIVHLQPTNIWYPSLPYATLILVTSRSKYFLVRMWVSITLPSRVSIIICDVVFAYTLACGFQ